MKKEMQVYKFVVNAEASFADNLEMKYHGVRLTSVEGEVVEFKNRDFEITTEQIRNNLIAINIFVVDDSDVETEQISYLLDEEYEPEILMDVFTKSTMAPVRLTLNTNGFMSCKRMMDIKMDPRVRSAIEFITSAFIDTDDELTAKLVDEFKTGKHDQTINFVNIIAEL